MGCSLWAGGIQGQGGMSPFLNQDSVPEGWSVTEVGWHGELEAKLGSYNMLFSLSKGIALWGDPSA